MILKEILKPTIILTELFDNPVKYSQSESSNFRDSYKFETKSGQKIEMNVYKLETFKHVGVDLEDGGLGFDFKNISEGGSEGITGTGDEIEIFSTVLDIISKSIKKYDPVLIAFGAHEKSRQSLYNKMIKYMKRKFNYKLLDKAPIMFPLGNSEYYVLRKSK